VVKVVRAECGVWKHIQEGSVMFYARGLRESLWNEDSAKPQELEAMIRECSAAGAQMSKLTELQNCM